MTDPTAGKLNQAIKKSLLSTTMILASNKTSDSSRGLTLYYYSAIIHGIFSTMSLSYSNTYACRFSPCVYLNDYLGLYPERTLSPTAEIWYHRMIKLYESQRIKSLLLFSIMSYMYLLFCHFHCFIVYDKSAVTVSFVYNPKSCKIESLKRFSGRYKDIFSQKTYGFSYKNISILRYLKIGN